MKKVRYGDIKELFQVYKQLTNRGPGYLNAV
jgi:hypothetical protein